MGCGVSRPVLDDDAPPPAGLSPIRRRIEEIKRSRKFHKRSKSHLSSKELLHDRSVVDDEDEEYYNDGCSRKSGVSCRLESIEEVENQGTPKHNHLLDKKEVVNESPDPAPPAAENVVVYNNVNVVVYGKNVNVVAEKKIEEHEEEKQHHVQEEKLNHVQDEKPHHIQEEKLNHVQDEKPHHVQEEKQHHVQEVKQDVDKAEKEEKEEQDQKEISDGLEDGYGSDFFPGSPSFREYCVFSADKDDDDDEEDGEEEVCKDSSNGDGEKREETTQRDESTEANEESVTVLVKKGHKGRKFKRILPKGGQAAVKNLMNVKSCYIPPCSNFQHRPTRLPPSTSA